jgi:hypothetical protein
MALLKLSEFSSAVRRPRQDRGAYSAQPIVSFLL